MVHNILHHKILTFSKKMYEKMHIRRCLPPSPSPYIFFCIHTYMHHPPPPNHPHLNCCLPVHLELPVGLLRERYVGESANEVFGISASQKQLTTYCRVLIPTK